MRVEPGSRCGDGAAGGAVGSAPQAEGGVAQVEAGGWLTGAVVPVVVVPLHAPSAAASARQAAARIDVARPIATNTIELGRFLRLRGRVAAYAAPVMQPIRFASRIRYWNPEKQSGLAVADIPHEHVAAIGVLKQQRVQGRIGSADFTSNVMPAGGGRLALSVSKALQAAARVSIGDAIDVEINAIGRD